MDFGATTGHLAVLCVLLILLCLTLFLLCASGNLIFISLSIDNNLLVLGHRISTKWGRFYGEDNELMRIIT